MDVKEIMNNVSERAKEAANVRAVFGDPIEMDGLTIIPVASVKLSGGGGGGAPEKDAEDSGHKGSGMGMGLRVYAIPTGYIEVRDGEAQYVDIVDKNKLALGGMITGGLLLLTAAKLLVWKAKRH